MKLSKARIEFFNQLMHLFHELIAIRHSGTNAEFDLKVQEIKEAIENE